MKKSKFLFSAVLLAAMLLSLVAPALPASANGSYFTIKGTMRDLKDAPIADVAVIVAITSGGTAVGTTTTDADGNFTLLNVPIGPSYLGFTKAGYLFTDWDGYTINNDYYVPNYNASIPEIDLKITWPYNPVGWIPHTISGKVWDGVSAGLGSVRVRISDYGAPFYVYKSYWTDPNGSYSFSGLADGVYDVWTSSVPSGYTITPDDLFPTVDGSNLTDQNFTYTRVYTIYGKVTDGTNPLANVMIDAGAGFSATTDSSGQYYIEGLSAGSYTLTASKTGYTFGTPISATITTADLNDQNFTGTQYLFSVSGAVTVSGLPLVGALIDAGGGYLATTDEAGAYAFSLLPVATYTLTPTKLGYTFSPTTLSAEVTNANLTGKNSTAAVDQPAPNPMPNEPVEVNVNMLPNGDSSPNSAAAYSGKLYFSADDGINGSELWTYNYSTGVSALVKDIFQGLDSGSPNSSSPTGFTVFNNAVYFSARMDSDANVYIWKTDGTTAGTTQVSTQAVSNGSDNTDNLLIPLNSKLYFMGQDPISGSNKLWSLDAAGTFAIVPLSPAADYTVTAWQNGVVLVFNNEVYFQATTESTGKALFKSDGTSITLVKSFPDGVSTHVNLQGFATIGSSLFFTLRQPGSPFLSQVWKSDGTPGGTVVVANMPTIDAARTIQIPFNNASGNYYLFAVSDSTDGTWGASELWRTDGTTTVLVKDFFVSGAPQSGADPSWSIVFNGSLYFRAAYSSYGIELWKTDGTAANTVMVKDINPGSGGNYISEYAVYAGSLYFAADDGSSGTELWKTTGSEASTVRVADINPNDSSYPGGFVTAGDSLFFRASDGAHGSELWSYNSAETLLEADINQLDGSSDPNTFINLDGKVYFVAKAGDYGRELWVFDPATGDKHIVQDIRPGLGNSNINYLTAMGGNLYFQANDGSGAKLWKLDVSTGTAALLLDKEGNEIPSPGSMIVMDGKLYFGQYAANKLYVSDGTPAGTSSLTAASAPAVSPAPYGIGTPGQTIIINHVLYFRGYNAANGEELWKTDGTAGGTILVKDIAEGSAGSNIKGMTELDGKLYFGAEGYLGGVDLGYELWVSDGTPDGTTSVTDLNPANKGSMDWMLACNSKLFFNLTVPASGNELYSSDGTTAGTAMVKEIEPGSSSSSPSNPVCFNNKLLFQAYTSLYGSELWSSDGTSDGTLMLDLYQGSTSSSPEFVSATENALYFTAEDPDFGTELWKTDGDLGNPAGTKRISDINPGTGSSSPVYMGRVGYQLFFKAYSATAGVEVYRVDTANNAVYLTKDLVSGTKDGANTGVPFLTIGNTTYYPGTTTIHGTEIWTISPKVKPSAFTSKDPLDGGVGTAYSHTFTAYGNPFPTFALKSGSNPLPGGLRLDGDTGVLSGTPTASGTFTFTLTASNSYGSADKAVTLTIGAGGNATATFTSSVPGTSMAGADYSHTFVANGTPAPTYAVTAGALPDGLTLDGDTGILSGKATVSGTFTFTITATNEGGSATQNVTLVLLPKPTVTMETNQPIQHEYGIAFSTEGGAPTGTVTFKDNTVAITGCSQVTLVNGAASCAIQRFLIGMHILTIQVDPGGSLPSGTLFSNQINGLIFPVIIFNTYTQ